MLNRRQFVRRSVVGLAALSGTGLAIEGFFREPHRPVPEHIIVQLERLPEAFEGFRVAQITDIHFGPYMDQPGLERAVRLAQEFQPDMVALTGDFVSHGLGQHNGPEGARNAEPCADVFARWKGAPPMIAVLGNHDHWNGPELVTALLRERGIVVLRNASYPLERDKQLFGSRGPTMRSNPEPTSRRRSRRFRRRTRPSCWPMNRTSPITRQNSPSICNCQDTLTVDRYGFRESGPSSCPIWRTSITLG